MGYFLASVHPTSINELWARIFENLFNAIAWLFGAWVPLYMLRYQKVGHRTLLKFTSVFLTSLAIVNICVAFCIYYLSPGLIAWVSGLMLPIKYAYFFYVWRNIADIIVTFVRSETISVLKEDDELNHRNMRRYATWVSKKFERISQRLHRKAVSMKGATNADATRNTVGRVGL